MDILKSFISLLALINPIGAIPFFMSLTAHQADAERRRTIRIAAISVFCVIAVTTLLGQQIISFFGISVGSLEVGGGIIMLLMAINMLNAQIGNSRSTPEERHEAEQKDNIAVVPLAIPLLTGPGAISTTIIYASASAHWYDRISLVAIGAVLAAICFFTAPRRTDCPVGGSHGHQHRHAAHGFDVVGAGGGIHRRRIEGIAA